MAQSKKNCIKVPFHFDGGDSGYLTLYEESENTLFEVDDTEAIDNLEANIQVVEGFSYEYDLENGYVLEEQSGLVKRSKLRDYLGRITPGIYTGTLQLRIFKKDAPSIYCPINIEVRSKKIGYRDDYRFMLEEISNQCIDLILQSTSLSSHNLTHDFTKDSKTLYQKFSFVKSVINSNEFMESVHRILTSPVTRWKVKDVVRDIRRAGRITRSGLRQIASAGNRISLPEGHPLRSRINSVPAKLVVDQKHESPDTPENQFIKHVLTTFLQFCTTVRGMLAVNGREHQEARQLENKLQSMLEHSLFKEISAPSMLPLNSPVLQRKEGYREVLNAWLKFDLSSKLAWSGGEDVYSAGKRNIASLYEYWLFFKLLELFQTKFSIEVDSIDALFKKTSDGLGLILKAGKPAHYLGSYHGSGRKLAVRFSFNRTFGGDQAYPLSGSWTKSMRPDYTFSFWPDEFTEQEAEAREIITHIHFDAKYKVVNVDEIFAEPEKSDDDESSDGLMAEKLSNQMGVYKQADLLKMHAYKDAIRRTGGAYVLYPGTAEPKQIPGFHEVLPGLGAFAIRPNASNSGIKELSNFIDNVIDQLLNRTSQMEEHSYYTYAIHKNAVPEKSKISDAIPEYWDKDKNRVEPANNIGVLVGYCKNEAHYQWIIDNRKYNLRMDSIQPEPMFFGAKYLLLHHKGELKTSDLWRISRSRPDILNREEMVKLGYPSPRDFYLVYSIEKVTDTEFNNLCWDITKLSAYKSGHMSARPFTVSLEDLMQVVCPKL